VTTSRHLFAILAIGALSSAIAAAAEQPGPDVKAGTAVASPGAASPGVASPGDVPGGLKFPNTGAEPGPGSVTGSSPVTGGGTDHGHDGSAKSGPGPGPGSGSGPGMTGASEGTHDNGAPGSKTPKGNTTDAMHEPIDTQITVNQGRRTPFRGLRISRSVADVSKSIASFKDRLLKTSKTAIAPATDPSHHGAHRLTPNSRSDATREGTARNAAGAAIAPRAAVPSSAGLTPTGSPRQNSAGLPAAAGPAVPAGGPQPQGSPAAGTVSAAHATMQLNGTAPINSVGPKLADGHPGTALAAVATTGAAINASTMIRPGSSSGAVSGAPKVVAGVLNGSSFRPRHP
jgi:hypothetical protein